MCECLHTSKLVTSLCEIGKVVSSRHQTNKTVSVTACLAQHGETEPHASLSACAQVCVYKQINVCVKMVIAEIACTTAKQRSLCYNRIYIPAQIEVIM